MTVCDGFANCFCKVGSMHRWEQTASLFSFSLSFIVKPPSFIKTKHSYIEKAKKKRLSPQIPFPTVVRLFCCVSFMISYNAESFKYNII